MEPNASISEMTGNTTRSPADLQQGSFDSFFLREQRGLLALAFALTGSHQAAEDIVQDALIATYDNWAIVAGLDQPLAWVRRVVTNRSTSLIRRRINDAKAITRIALRREQLDRGSMPSDSAHLWHLIRRLPPRQAQVITLKAVHQLSLQEIGEVLEISKETAQTHLQRGRATLTRQIEKGRQP